MRPQCIFSPSHPGRYNLMEILIGAKLKILHPDIANCQSMDLRKGCGVKVTNSDLVYGCCSPDLLDLIEST